MIAAGLKVLWLARRSYAPGETVEPHFHDFYHFIYIVKPGGSIEIQKKRYGADQDVLFTAAKNTSHGIFPDGRLVMRTLEFKAIVTDAQLSRELPDLPVRIEDASSNVKVTLENLIEEGVNRRKHYRDLINVKFAELLIHLIRGAESGGAEADRGRNTEDMAPEKPGAKVSFAPVLEYMRANISKCMELEELSSILNMHPSYFCRLFQYEFGTPPIQYLLQLRIQYARSLLLDTRLTISEIAYRVGFQSIHYFSRYFHKKEHLSPVQYREKYQDEHSYIVLEKDGYNLSGTLQEVQALMRSPSRGTP